ncbi:MAG: hypothetical protein KDC24_03340 [Saprospiraceae bacterium]|nr:hypothetical protein [Saprospiraceae bacterium]
MKTILVEVKHDEHFMYFLTFNIYFMKANFSSLQNNLPKTLLFVFAVLGMALWGGCKKDNVDPDPGPSSSITQQLTSDSEGGVISLGDFDLVVSPNSIPTLADGSTATVTFSVEKNGAMPKTLPGEIDKKGDLVHFGPEGFIFQEPLFVMLPLPPGETAESVSIITYDNETESYKVYPTTYFDPETNIIGTGVYNLGYFFLGNIEDVTEDLNSNKGQGGFHLYQLGQTWYPIDGVTWHLSSHLGPWYAVDNYHKLFLTNFEFAYDEQRSWYVDMHRWVVQTPPNVTGWKPNHNIGIKFIGPQGTYTWGLRISHKYFQLDLPECQDYSIPWVITVDKPVTCTFSGCTNYSTITNLPSNGTWTPVSCFSGYNRPEATVPVCTGDFQATLTWYNGTGGDTDLDLHLYGPDNMHVYYSSKIGPNGILLDRDIISTPGYVQENICAPNMNDMPRGEYRIEVDHYSGIEKDFQVRVVRGNYSNSYSSTLSSDGAFIVETFTLE